VQLRALCDASSAKRGELGRSGVQTPQCGNVVENEPRVVMLREDPLGICNKVIATKIGGHLSAKLEVACSCRGDQTKGVRLNVKPERSASSFAADGRELTRSWVYDKNIKHQCTIQETEDRFLL
jgi:hypothetical protein